MPLNESHFKPDEKFMIRKLDGRPFWLLKNVFGCYGKNEIYNDYRLYSISPLHEL